MNTLAFVAALTALGSGAAFQAAPTPLDSLISIALGENPALRASRERVRASEARARAAGTRPDPRLSLSIQNFPVSDPGFHDFMTMKTVGLSQRLPYPGKLPLARAAAESSAESVRAASEDLRLDVVRQVRVAYYELTLVDRKLDIVSRQVDVVSALAATADVRYAVGAVGQEDVLQAQVEIGALVDEAARLTERRVGIAARLNGLLNRPPDHPLGAGHLPDRLATAALGDAPTPSFASLELGSRAAGSPIRPLDELIATALERNPRIRQHVARIEAQRTHLAFQQKSHLPDFEMAMSYGQRNDRADMLSVSIAIPLPLNRSGRQDEWTIEAASDLAALEAEHEEHVNRLRSRIAEVHSDAERSRTSLAVLATGMMAQESAALHAASAGFGVGRTEFQTVLAIQTALFRIEIAYDEALVDFAKSIADLERLVGEEVLR